MSTTGERIRQVRQQAGFTQAAFGKALNVTSTHMSHVELSRMPPSKVLLKLISYEFGVNYRWLLDGTEEMKLPPIPPQESATATRQAAPVINITLKLDGFPDWTVVCDLMKKIGNQAIPPT